MSAAAGPRTVDRVTHAAALEPWHAVDRRPLHGTLEEQLEFAVRCAILAPSSHNTQPWRFRVEHGTLELLADRSRALPVVDPHGRELVISCGAALFHIRAALRAVGRDPLVERTPSGANLLARVRPGVGAEPTEEEVRLLAAIPRRHTNRAAFERRALPRLLGPQLKRAVATEGIELVLVTADGLKRKVSSLIAEADQRQWSDPAFRSELAAWTRPNHSERRDGVPGYGLGRGRFSSVITPVLIKRFDMGDSQAERDSRLAQDAPALAIVTTGGDAPADWLAAGEALAHMLLRAEVEGVCASFANQPVEVEALRGRLGGLLGDRGLPQLVVRLGFAAEPARPTPRRPLAEVLLRGDPYEWKPPAHPPSSAPSPAPDAQRPAARSATC
jgi:nitroreductase